MSSGIGSRDERTLYANLSYLEGASATYGNYNTLEVEGMANLPVSETLALRLSAKTIQQWRGYYFNRTIGDDVGKRDVVMGRAQMRWRPSDSADINLKVQGFSINSELGVGQFFDGRDFANPPTNQCVALAQGMIDFNCTSPFGYNDLDGDPLTGDWSPNNFYHGNQINATLRGVFDLGGPELTSITGFIDADRQYYSELDASPKVVSEFIPTTDVRQYSPEFRLAGAAGDRFDWLVGAFYSNDHIVVGSTGIFDEFFLTRTTGFGDQKTNSAAGFVHDEYAITDKLKLIGGLRVTWERKTYTAGVFDVSPFGTSCLISATCTPGPTPPVQLAGANDLAISDTNLSWKAGLDWKPAPSTLVYASVARGVKSGGFFFGFATSNNSFRPFEPGSLISYEAGLKHRLWTGRCASPPPASITTTATFRPSCATRPRSSRCSALAIPGRSAPREWTGTADDGPSIVGPCSFTWVVEITPARLLVSESGTALRLLRALP